MLEEYFVKPATVDRIRASWIGAGDRALCRLAGRARLSPRACWRRVPLLVAFGEFARVTRAPESPTDLPAMSTPSWPSVSRVAGAAPRLGPPDWPRSSADPVEQMLRVVLPGYEPSGRHTMSPFAGASRVLRLPGERAWTSPGLHLPVSSPPRPLRGLSRRESASGVSELSPALLSAFVAERAGRVSPRRPCETPVGCCVCSCVTRTARASSAAICATTVEWPQVYRLSTIPRSISWDEVGEVLAGVDRRTAGGKRDYAILLLLVTYGLRGREVAALTLDDIDWKRERLAVPERKAGHSTAFPLSTAGRRSARRLPPAAAGRQPATATSSSGAMAPVQPARRRRSFRLRRPLSAKAGIEVPRPGSHTLRHTSVQRLVDADFALKTIGDFVGHRSAASTEIYAKVAIESLREVALGDGEEVLA